MIDEKERTRLQRIAAADQAQARARDYLAEVERRDRLIVAACFVASGIVSAGVVLAACKLISWCLR